MIYDCEFRPVAPIEASSHETVIVHEAVILIILHITGFAYGAIVSDHEPVQTQRVAFVVPGISVMFEISFPLGFEIVTVESIIVVPLSVVGALNVTLGGN